MKNLKTTLTLFLLGMIAFSAQTQAQNDTVRLTAAFPTGKKTTSVMLLEKTAPRNVWLNRSFSYQLTVTNITANVLRDVTLTETLAKDFKLASTSPKATTLSNGKLRWSLGNLAPKASKTFTVTGTASKLGAFENCATLAYDMGACLAINVIEPALKLTKTAPDKVLLCDTIPMTITVTNTGVGAARNVVITDALPKGMTTTDGKTSLSYNLGSLAAGQSRQFDILVKASKTGSFTNNAVAKADGGLTANASAKTIVSQPVLTITKKGPAKRFEGRPIKYSLHVANTGDGVAKKAVVTDVIPAGTRVLKIGQNGTQVGNQVVWELGDLAVGASRDLTLALVGTRLGHIKNVATVKAYCATAVAATAKTEVAGIPAILLELIDEQDPIEIDANVTYMIRVTNQGSLAGTNINIATILEKAMVYVSSTGATKGTVSADGRSVTFAPLASLAPKKQAVWRVVVKAAQTGDVRFGV